MNQARCDNYTNHIQQNRSDHRKLFNVTKPLLCDTNTASFPHVDTVQLANDLGNFFAQKIENINASLIYLHHPYHLYLLLTLHAWKNSLPVSGLSLENKCACWLVKQRVNLVNSTPFPLRLFSSCWTFYCQLSLSWSTSLLTPVDSLRPGKRRCVTISQEAWFGFCVQKFPSSQ